MNLNLRGMSGPTTHHLNNGTTAFIGRVRSILKPWLWTVLLSSAALILLVPHTLVVPTLALSIALAFWCIATVVRLMRPGEALVHRIYWLNLAFAGAIALRQQGTSAVAWGIDLQVLCLAMLPYCFLTASVWLASSQRVNGMPGMLARTLGIAGIATALLFAAANAVAPRLDPYLLTAALSLATVGFASGMTAIARACGQPRSALARGQAEVILLGASVALFPLVALCFFPTIASGEPLVPVQTAAVFSVVLPIAFAYALLRRNVLDTRMVVKRPLVHSGVTLLLAAFYAVGLWALTASNYEQWNHGVPSVALFAAALLTFAPANSAARRTVDIVFYRDRHSYAGTLRTLSQRLASADPLAESLAAVTSALTQAMNLDCAAILIRQPEGAYVVASSSGDCRDELSAEIPIDLMSSEFAAAKERGGGARTIPMLGHGELQGLLYLGSKAPPAEFTAADLGMVQTLASQAATAIANAGLAETLARRLSDTEVLKNRLLQVQDEERKRIAEDLHDGALHTALEMVRQADPTSLHASCDPESVLRLELLGNLGRDISYQLRELSAHLYPSELGHLGLVAALGHLSTRASHRENVAVSVSRCAFPQDLRLPAAIEEALYRATSEAIDNVVRHSGASQAIIVLQCVAGEVLVSIEDNGGGFAAAPRAASVCSGHLGLVSMRERVEAVGGTCTIESALGNGTTVNLRAPVRPNYSASPGLASAGQ